jgi:hypothetical protein
MCARQHALGRGFVDAGNVCVEFHRQAECASFDGIDGHASRDL